MAIQLRLVPRPHHQIEAPCDTNDVQLAYPGNLGNQVKWLKAVQVLRTKTKKGWVIDKPVPRKPTA